jgi:hypothetical protein
MSAGIVTLIIVVAAIVVVAVGAGVVYDARRRRLRQRFGPEYDRLVGKRESRRKAEAELAEREKRVRGLDIRPLDPAAQSRYAGEWAAIQERFVDAPQQSVTGAQRLVMAVMSERGYPTEGSDQMAADLSVEHASTLDHYRAAHDISQRAEDDQASTEDLRQAMIHYRALFQDLLGQAGGPEIAAAGPELVTPDPGHGTVPAEPGPAVPDEEPAAAGPEALADDQEQEPTAAGQDQDVVIPEQRAGVSKR